MKCVDGKVLIFFLNYFIEYPIKTVTSGMGVIFFLFESIVKRKGLTTS